MAVVPSGGSGGGGIIPVLWEAFDTAVHDPAGAWKWARHPWTSKDISPDPFWGKLWNFGKSAFKSGLSLGQSQFGPSHSRKRPVAISNDRGPGPAKRVQPSIPRSVGRSGPRIMGKYGVSRSYRKRAARKFSRKRKKFARVVKSTQWVSFMRQNTGQATATGHAARYIGHSTACPASLSNVVWLAVLRKLAKKMGIDFDSGERCPQQFYADATLTQSVGKVVINWKHETDDAWTQTTVTFSDAADWYTMATEITSAIDTSIDTTANGPLFFQSIEFYRADGGGTEAYQNSPNAVVDLMRCKVSLNVFSQLRMQNVTESTSTAGDDQITDVKANPLEGRMYYFGKRGYAKRAFDTNNTTAVAILPDTNFGFLGLDGGSGSLKASEANVFKRLAHKNAFVGVSKTKDMILPPGGILTSKLTYKKSFWFSNLMQRMLPYFQNGVLSTLVGNCKLYAFDHTVESTSEGVVTLDYQQDLKFAAFIKEKPLKFIPQHV